MSATLSWTTIKSIANAPELIGQPIRVRYTRRQAPKPTGFRVGVIKTLSPAKPLAWWEHMKAGFIIAFSIGFVGFMGVMIFGIIAGLLGLI